MLGPLWRKREMSLTMTSSVPAHGRILYVALIAALGCGAGTMIGSPPAQSTPTAGQVPRDYSKVETEVLSALNTARTSPSSAVAWLDELSRYYSGNHLLRPGTTIPIVTNE